MPLYFIEVFFGGAVRPDGSVQLSAWRISSMASLWPVPLSRFFIVNSPDSYQIFAGLSWVQLFFTNLRPACPVCFLLSPLLPAQSSPWPAPSPFRHSQTHAQDLPSSSFCGASVARASFWVALLACRISFGSISYSPTCSSFSLTRLLCFPLLQSMDFT